jgi:hypothetical protein
LQILFRRNMSLSIIKIFYIYIVRQLLQAKLLAQWKSLALLPIGT